MEILKDQNYANQMRSIVLPYLTSNRYTGCFSSPGVLGTIYYERYLPASQNLRAIIVIAHGFTESAQKYQELIYYFLQAGYGVFIYDQRGHGRSERAVEDFSCVHIESWAHYAADLLYISTEIARKEYPTIPLCLYAHSMGGGIGAAFLEMYPQVFDRAILSSPMIKPLTGGIPFKLAMCIADLMVLLGKGTHYAWGQHAFLGNESFEKSCDTSRERFEYYHEIRCANHLFQTNGASWSWLSEAGKLYEFIVKPDNLAGFSTPTLLFQACEDNTVDTSAQCAFASAAGGVEARLVCVEKIDGSKHEIFMSQSEVLENYIQRICAFLDNSQESYIHG